MINQVYLLMLTGLLAFDINIILQYFVVKSRISKIEKEWKTVKALLSLSSFRNYLDVVSADEAQEVLEQLLVGLRTLPSADLVTEQVSEKLGTLKKGLRALLDSLDLVDSLNLMHFNVKKSYEIGSFMAYLSLVLALLSIAFVSTSYFFLLYGTSAGLSINSLILLLSMWINISKIQKVKNRLKRALQ